MRRVRASAVSVVGEAQISLAANLFHPFRLENGRINALAFKQGPLTGAMLVVDVLA
jgi:hypothetical protein